jgi:glycolate oxidase
MKQDDLLCYEYDASQIKGLAKDVFFPRNILELKNIIKSSKRICIRGGGSGLVGGAVPLQNQDLVLDTSKLNKISNLDLKRNTIEVEAGVILEDLQNYLKEYNLEFPINPSSKSVCTIGGMIATNSIGSRSIKYKNTENWIRWIEVVDCSGLLQRTGRTEISDYAGMEGITGVIVKACLNLILIPNRSATLVKIEKKEEILSIVKHLKLNEKVSMIELVDKIISSGIGLDEKYHLIIEYEDESGLLKNEEYDNLMHKKDNLYQFIAGEGYTRIEDPKIPQNKISLILDWLEQKKIPVFGSIGIGILHPCFYKGQEKHLPELINILKKVNAKISGKHGVGILKKDFVQANDKKIITNIKKRTDPLNKFNIGKMI